MMDNRSIENLLREADRAAGGAPQPATGLSSRVRIAQQRRRRQNMVAGVATAGLALAVALALFARYPSGSSDLARRTESGGTAGLPSSVEGAPSDEEIRALLAERSQLAAQAESHARVASRLIELIERNRRIEDRRQHHPAPDALILAREEVDKAAFRLILRANDLRERQGDEDATVARYREVVRLFPRTQSADIARRSLADMKREERGML